MKSKNKWAIAGCATTALLFNPIVQADTIQVTGTYTGASGGPVTSPYDSGRGVGGAPGTVGYTAESVSSTYVFTNATITGGNGGAYVGAFTGGLGTLGVEISLAPQVTFNSGTYSGGVGGATGGISNGGVNALLPGGGQLTINGGTFNGAAPSVGGSNGGPGITVGGASNTNPGTVAILGGTFNGGLDSDALYLGGEVKANIYGGTFATPTTDQPALLDSDTPVTIYGTNFEIDGAPVGYGPISLASGTLTGLLQDNLVSTSITYAYSAGGTINLAAPVPEPTSIGLIFGGAVAAPGRRRVNGGR